MINSLFFDTDCLCAFLWVGNESLLPILYPDRIVIPRPVYIELANPRIPQLKERTDELVESRKAVIKEIDIDSEEYQIYYKLTEAPDEGHPVIGNGEAASISLAKQYGGIVASNNLRDIAEYIREFGLGHTTTADILVDAFREELISESDGNHIWRQMLAKRRRLGAASFTDYLDQKNKRA